MDAIRSLSRELIPGTTPFRLEVNEEKAATPIVLNCTVGVAAFCYGEDGLRRHSLLV